MFFGRGGGRCRIVFTRFAHVCLTPSLHDTLSMHSCAHMGALFVCLQATCFLLSAMNDTSGKVLVVSRLFFVVTSATVSKGSDRFALRCDHCLK